MANFLASMMDFLTEQRLPMPPVPLIVGLSGGLDSVVMTHTLVKLGFHVQAVHVNYQLRGAESEGDEAFVRGYCAGIGIPLHVSRYETKAMARAEGRSVQETARDLRYRLMEDVAHQAGAGFIAVAHHADDQAETVLLNLLRGTGLEGLAGIPVSRPIRHGAALRVIRPMLFARRMDVIAYAQENGLNWRDDTSNFDVRYRRNLIRQRLLPMILKDFGDTAIGHLVETAQDVREFLQEDFYPKLAQIFEQTADEAKQSLRIPDLAMYAPVWRQRMYMEALRRWIPGFEVNRDVLERLDALIRQQTGNRVQIGSQAVWRDRDGLVFAANEEIRPELLVLPETGTYHTAWGTLRLTLLRPESPMELLPQKPTQTEYLDATRITFPLSIRAWQEGDVFHPLGMKGKQKKVSDFLTDLKIPTATRKTEPVLTDAAQILCILRHRPDEAFRLTPQTQTVLEVSLRTV